MISWAAFAGICLAVLIFIVGTAIVLFFWCDGFDMQETMARGLKRALRTLSGATE